MKLRIWAALCSIYIIWGSTYLAIRFAIQSMPPFLMAGVRFLIAGSILFVWRTLARDPKPTPREWRSTAIVGLFLLLGGNGCVVWAEQRVVSGVTALLIGSTPFWFVLLDALRPGGVKPSWKNIAGVFIGFVGIVLLIGPTEFAGNGQGVDLLGSVVLLFAALFWATGSLFARDAKLPSSPLLSTGMEMLVGGASLFFLGTITGEWSSVNLSAITLPSFLGLAYLIVFGSLVGFAAYTWLLKAAPTPLVATYAYVNPVVAIFLGNLLAQEPLTLHVLLSALIIVSAVVLINSARKTPRTVAEKQA
jgi:drug/metabolite transporter (DMT)-like permease